MKTCLDVAVLAGDALPERNDGRTDARHVFRPSARIVPEPTTRSASGHHQRHAHPQLFVSWTLRQTVRPGRHHVSVEPEKFMSPPQRVNLNEWNLNFTYLASEISLLSDHFSSFLIAQLNQSGRGLAASAQLMIHSTTGISFFIPPILGRDSLMFLIYFLKRYGQMTAGSYCYIGPQGIVHGTTVKGTQVPPGGLEYSLK